RSFLLTDTRSTRVAAHRRSHKLMTATRRGAHLRARRMRAGSCIADTCGLRGREARRVGQAKRRPTAPQAAACVASALTLDATYGGGVRPPGAGASTPGRPS